MRETGLRGRKSQEFGYDDPCPLPPSLPALIPRSHSASFIDSRALFFLGGRTLVGQKTNLIVSVLSFAPRVHCSVPSGLVPADDACAELRNNMFASQNVEVFGPEEQPGVEAGLPQSWLASPSMGLGSCAVVVNTRGPLDSASWFEMWAGAGAVAAMCVRRGLAGISTGQGDFVPFLWLLWGWSEIGE